MSNAVPREWNSSNMGELCKFTGGSAFKEKYQGNTSGDYPFIKVSDMNLVGNERFITKSSNWINENVRSEAKTKLFPAKSVVFAKVGAALLLNRRRMLTCDTAIDNNMMVATPYQDDSNFLYYVLQDVDLGEIVQSGAVPSVNQSQMEDIPVLIPPLPEQQKIAAILSSVDDVIEKTQAQIDKLKDLKTGMMQELLTKGIGHTEFKDSPVGRIPVGWDVKTLGDVVIEKGLQTGPFGSQLHAHEYVEQGIPVVMPKDMRHCRVDPVAVARITPEKVEQLQKHKVHKGDILFSRRGDIGRFALIQEGNEGWICGTGCLKVRLSNVVVPSFFTAYLTLKSIVEWLNTNAVGQTMLNLNTTILSELPVVLPSIEEQTVIANSIGAVDQRTELLIQKRSALNNTKKALMQDLLTGKVRVKV